MPTVDELKDHISRVDRILQKNVRRVGSADCLVLLREHFGERMPEEDSTSKYPRHYRCDDVQKAVEGVRKKLRSAPRAEQMPLPQPTPPPAPAGVTTQAPEQKPPAPPTPSNPDPDGRGDPDPRDVPDAADSRTGDFTPDLEESDFTHLHISKIRKQLGDRKVDFNMSDEKKTLAAKLAESVRKERAGQADNKIDED